MEWLQEILEGVENAAEVVTKIKQELPKHFIPKDKYNALAQSKRQLEEMTKEQEREGLKGFAVDFALKALTGESKPRDVDLVRGLIDMQKVSVGEDGEISGVFEQLEDIKQQKPFLFGAQALAGRTPVAGGDDSISITSEQFEKMSYREKVEMYEKSPELYKQLKQ
jgi:hypothetical protein